MLPTIVFFFRRDPFAHSQAFSLMSIFKKSRNETSVENSIAVIGVKTALLIGKLIGKDEVFGKQILTLVFQFICEIQ